MIELKKLVKHYPSRQGRITALDNVSLTIKSGEIFGIVGKSGAGKSTLLRSINLLDQPNSGDIIIDDINITQLDNKQLRQTRQRIGMIFQHFNLLKAKTIFENIALPLRLQNYNQQQLQAKVLALLDKVELRDKQHAYPSQLSGGQKQRVAIARALASDPKILLCDEATSALDPQTTASILALLKKIHQELGLTIVLITHEMEVVKTICDRVAVMANGQIVETADVFQLFSQPKTTLSKQLVARCIEQALPYSIAEQLQSQATAENHCPLLKIRFYGESAKQPIITQIFAETNIQLNVVQANFNYINNQAIGVIVVEVMADNTQLPIVLEKCAQYGLDTEVLGYVPTSLA